MLLPLTTPTGSPFCTVTSSGCCQPNKEVMSAVRSFGTAPVQKRDTRENFGESVPNDGTAAPRPNTNTAKKHERSTISGTRWGCFSTSYSSPFFFPTERPCSTRGDSDGTGWNKDDAPCSMDEAKACFAKKPNDGSKNTTGRSVVVGAVHGRSMRVV